MTTATATDPWTLCTVAQPPTTPETLWLSWSLAPAALLPLLLMLGLAVAGWRRGHDRDGAWRRAAFLAGWLLLALALLSPLCRLAATLVTGHMLQFMVLVLAAPLLLALGRPWSALSAGPPPSLRERPPRARVPTGEGLGALAIAYGALIWLWHEPRLYALILSDPVAHVAAYALLVAVSTAFWSAVVSARGVREGQAAIALGATLAHTGLLGALLAFAAAPLYPVQAAGALAWGLDPLRDQQLAGLIMWVPGGFFYLAAGVAVCARMLDRRLAEADAPDTPRA